MSDTTNFVDLQNQIVDPRFAAKDWRAIQNYVGQTMRDYTAQVHFVCPKPEDVGDLMEGWMECARRLQDSSADPIAAEAAMAFGFVFVHPFEDGNGRIHRFLIHHELARSGFAPPKLIFPVSAVMLRERVDYDRILESYSKTILHFIEFTLDAQGSMTVENETSGPISVLGCYEVRRIFVRLRRRDYSTRLARGTWFLSCIRSGPCRGNEHRRYAGPTSFTTNSIYPPESRHAVEEQTRKGVSGAY